MSDQRPYTANPVTPHTQGNTPTESNFPCFLCLRALLQMLLYIRRERPYGLLGTRAGSQGRPRRLWHSSWALTWVLPFALHVSRKKEDNNNKKKESPGAILPETRGWHPTGCLDFGLGTLACAPLWLFQPVSKHHCPCVDLLSTPSRVQ